ncbi:MAG: ribonuclease III [Spirochaetaceae bacterium]|nr:ribonuclease III [Spirochaetaceae bacterium]
MEALFPEINAERKNRLRFFCRNAGIKFKNIRLLNLALMHRSVANETQIVGVSFGARPDGGKINNERLEFLGDAILGAVTATLLYRCYGEKSEGELAKIKSVVVSEDILCGIARELQVDGVIILGKGEELSGGRTKNALLADAVEAVIGAFYLDSGYKAVFPFVERCVMPEIKRVVEHGYHRDYKSLLQEFTQREWKTYPVYRCTDSGGAEHKKTFWVEVAVHGKNYGPCIGHSKKSAEQEAARKAYEALAIEPHA